MPTYKLPKIPQAARARKNEVLLVASGDLRLSANQQCWAAQAEMEAALSEAVAASGYKLVRGHKYDPTTKHGFISSQRSRDGGLLQTRPAGAVDRGRSGLAVLAPRLVRFGQPPRAAVDGRQLVGHLARPGRHAQSQRFIDQSGTQVFVSVERGFFRARFPQEAGPMVDEGPCPAPYQSCHSLVESQDRRLRTEAGQQSGRAMQREKAIMGVFDEGCMGMYNAIIPDELLHPVGMYKERLSQSALYYETTQVPDDEAAEVRQWMEQKGHDLPDRTEPRPRSTDAQILTQCKMYIAALRIADDFGCDLIGIQYQQGLKDLMPASDLVEGTLNNTQRPPVKSRDGKRVLYRGQPLPHFNEVDECAGLDALMTFRVHRAMGQPVENTLHDMRWGDWDASGTTDQYVWVFLISGSAPPAHFIGGWKGASSERQPAHVFPQRWRDTQGDLETG